MKGFVPAFAGSISVALVEVTEENDEYMIVIIKRQLYRRCYNGSQRILQVLSSLILPEGFFSRYDLEEDVIS